MHFIGALLVIAATSVPAGNKSMYDLGSPGGAPLTKATGLDRWTISGSVAAATIIEGGYFTLGTTAGASQLALDDNCGITFGHPYAKTSYPLLQIDGVWGRPEKFFATTGAAPRRAGDSLIMTYRLPGKYEVRLSVYLENGGAKVHLASQLTNLDAVQHSFAIGFVLDPALGKAGDGVVSIGGMPVLRDTLIGAASLGSKTVSIAERSSANSGLTVALAFTQATPASLILANWDDVVNADAPLLPQTAVRRLYDAVMMIAWPSATIPASQSLLQEVAVTVTQPNFGTGVFLRWDVPVSQSLENGIPFPAAVTSHVTVENLSQSAKNNLAVKLTVPAIVQAAASSAFTMVAQQSAASLAFPLQFKAPNEDKVIEMLVLCTENNVVLDSLIHPFRLCSAPVSDTGLAVKIDSVITAAYPTVSLAFTVTRQATGQNILSLTTDNVFFYENGTRIDDPAFGKDTTGGVASVDVVFVLDVTGSMSGSIAGVKNNILEFADSLSSRGVNFRLGMVTFLDANENIYDFTSNAAAFKANVSLQYAHGGGDFPENSLDALFAASQMAFRPTAKRVFVWITDATYHEKNSFTTRNRQDVLSQLLTADAIVHAIGPPAYQTDWYTPFTQATGGNFYSINGNFRDILLDIGNLKGSNRYLLSYTTQQPKTATKELRLTIHYAGLGGTAMTAFARRATADAAARISCFPNPFNPRTTLRMAIPAGTRGSVQIYNVLGQRVRAFDLAGRTGSTDIVWGANDEAGRDVAAGLYFIRFALYSSDNRLLSADVAKLLYVK